MEKSYLKFIIFIFLLTGCGLNKSMISVLDGNLKYNRGDYTGATISYLKVIDETKYKNWLHYNLGNAYSSLGEVESAIGEIKKSTSEDKAELLFKAYYNLGVIYFELGDFQQAIANFKDSLRVNQKDLDAKINLELAVKKWLSQQETEEIQLVNSPKGKEELGKEMNMLLKKIQSMEEKVWTDITHKKGPESQEEDW